MAAGSGKKQFVAPILPRVTSWTPERIAALSLPEVKQLHTNALRLQEPEVAEMCAKSIKDRPRVVAVKKPAAKVVVRRRQPAPLMDGE